MACNSGKQNAADQTDVQPVPETQSVACGQYLLLVHGSKYLWKVPGSVDG